MATFTFLLDGGAKTFTIKPIPRMGMMHSRVAFYRGHALFAGKYGHLYAHRDFPTNNMQRVLLNDPELMEAMAVCLLQLGQLTQKQCDYLLGEAADMRKRQKREWAERELEKICDALDLEHRYQELINESREVSHARTAVPQQSQEAL